MILSLVSLMTCPIYGESNTITPLLKNLPDVITINIETDSIFAVLNTVLYKS
jgi:hypothetical protein